MKIIKDQPISGNNRPQSSNQSNEQVENHYNKLKAATMAITVKQELERKASKKMKREMQKKQLNRGWAVGYVGAHKYTYICKNKFEAMEKAMQLGRGQHSKVVIRNLNE